LQEAAVALPIEQAAINLAAAVALSSVIGFERQWHNRLAGLRTNTLVALGAATFVVFSDIVPGEGSPTRIAAQVVSGIGFLGAGLIFREGLSVRGLNTAATLWCSAAVGVLAGAGYLAAAAVATSFVAFINLLLRPIVRVINRQPLSTTELEVGYLISLTSRSADEAHIRALLLQGVAAGDLALRGLDSRDVNGTGQVIVNAHLIAHSRVDAAVENIVGRLSLEQTICAARWQVQTSLDLDHQSLTFSDAAGLVPTVVEYSNARVRATMEDAGAGIVEQPTQQTDKILLAHRTKPPRIYDRKLEP
jgi:putative Mg2+ transporter-C (MgtC) family protein